MTPDDIVDDPYFALGVTKDADISAIRSAHRKLVLKFHPDRIYREAERAAGKDTFQKIQQAYELLSDPTVRSRYDDRVKLAQLKKEKAARGSPPRTASYPMRVSPLSPSTPMREYRDRRIYEEREPNASYFEGDYHYREEEPRITSRKYDGYERERRPDFAQLEKERKSTKWPNKAASDLPFDITLKFKTKAEKLREADKEKRREKETHASSPKNRDWDRRRERMDRQSSRRAYVEEDDSSSDSDTVTYASISQVGKTKEAVKEKTRERATHTSSTKTRDRDQRRERMGKPSSRRAYVEEDNSSSDSDTITYVSINRPGPRTSKSTYSPPPRTKSKREPTRNSAQSEEKDEQENIWHSFGTAGEYFERSQRPGLYGRTSPSQLHWETRDSRQTRRQSGSDTDTRPRSSKGRRPSIDIQKTRRPLLPSHNSAPSGLAGMGAQLDKDGSRSKQRSSTGATNSRACTKEMPLMSRSQKMPSSKSRKGDAVPSARSSKLKYAEIPNSGYDGSGSQTPYLSRTSPPRYGPTRYQTVEDEDDVSTILVDPEDRHRRTRSPSPPLRERGCRDRPQRPTVSIDSRPQSSRGTSYQHLKRTRSYDYTGPVDSRGRSFWGSDPVSPRQTRQPTTTALSLEAVISEKLLPHNENTQEVECDVCGLDVKLDQKRDRQKHILEDLRPYQCLEIGCPSASETYSSYLKLLAHVEKQHSKSELLTAKVLACPFCKKDLPQRKLQRLKHVGSHMEEIVLSRAYEDWTFYSDSEKYQSSAFTEEQQEDNKVAETLGLPSAPSENPAASEESNMVQTKANASSSIAKEASEMGEASDARQTNQEDEFGGPDSAKGTNGLSAEAH